MVFRSVAVAGVLSVFASLAGASASAEVLITVDKSTQKMTVAVDGATRHTFTVSTGRAGFNTPNGSFRPTRMHRTWFSRKYYNSPMPHSIFFHGGYAIHGSSEIRRLGGPASHGCVRLAPANAAALFALVKAEGAANTRIVVTGSVPETRTAQRKEHRRAERKVKQARRNAPARAARAYARAERPYQRAALRGAIYEDYAPVYYRPRAVYYYYAPY